MVRGGRVETMNSAVVGEGRRMRRYGFVVSMAVCRSARCRFPVPGEMPFLGGEIGLPSCLLSGDASDMLSLCHNRGSSFWQAVLVWWVF